MSVNFDRTANSQLVASTPEIFELQLRLGDRPPEIFLGELDLLESVDARSNPAHREVFEHTDSLVRSLAGRVAELDARFAVGVRSTCGSAFDGTKVGIPDEFDYLLVLESPSEEGWEVGEDFRLTADGPVWHDLSGDDSSILPELLHRRFAQLVDEAMESMTLPGCLKHGGFARPQYSGVRSHRFAHMLQLIWHPGQSGSSNTASSFPVTVDLTLVISAPRKIVDEITSDLQTNQLFSGHVELLRPHIPSTIHVIPSENQGWVVTTAALDFAIMEMFAANSQLKRSIRVCKLIRDRFLTIQTKHVDDSSETSEVLADLGCALDSNDRKPRDALKDFIDETLPPGTLLKLGEFTAPSCSASSGFIKYLAISEAFAVSRPQFADSPYVDVELILTILRKMRKESGPVPHPILPKNLIWPVSMHPYFSARSHLADRLMSDWYVKLDTFVGVLEKAVRVWRGRRQATTGRRWER